MPGLDKPFQAARQAAAIKGVLANKQAVLKIGKVIIN
jgi:hypothetical protein